MSIDCYVEAENLDPAYFIHRLHFGFLITFHYLFPQLTMGLAPLIVILKTIALRTGNAAYDNAARFWMKIFGINFVLGVVTGIPMEFQFGTNWARFSQLTGGVIGQAELWVTMHLFSTIGAHVLAVFLFIAAVILLTGAGVATSINSLRRSTEELAATVVRKPPRQPLLPPEPDTSELVVRATHVEAPPPPAAHDPGEHEASEQLQLEPDPEAPRELPATEPDEPEPDGDALTPQGRFRASVT